MKRSLLPRAVLGALVLSTLAATPVLAHGDDPASDFQDAGWVRNRAREIFGSFSDPPAIPGIAKVYVVGPVDGAHPLDNITLDPHFPYVHDHVSDRVPYERRQLASFNVLRPGPRATSENLLTRTVYQNPDAGVIEPDDGSFHITPELQMPYAIKVAGLTIPLTSTAKVRLGIALGILTTVQIARDVAITGWTGHLIDPDDGPDEDEDDED